MLFQPRSLWIQSTALLCATLLIPGDVPLAAQTPSPAPAQASPQAATQDSAPIPPAQLDSLVAPIALYPDPLLAQVLAASTYPLEIVQLQQWLAKHKDLKDKALADAVAKESWDASVQSMANLPDLVKQLADNVQWTSELGDAFLAQQNDVMDAVQRMRAKAKDTGNLKSNEQMKVETKVVESKQVIVVEQANPQVVYVPSYNPTVVYGAAPPVYAYPPIAYPPPGYYAAGMAISFGVGVAMGAFWGGGGWGYNCGWHGGGNTINVNNNNNFVRNSNNIGNGNVGNGNRGNGNRGGNNGNWQHNPQHRGGAPYSNRATAQQFGGTARGDSATARRNSAQQRTGQQAGAANRGDRGGAQAGNRAQPGSLAAKPDAGGNRGAAANRGSSGRSGDSVGNRQVSSGSRSGGSGAFSGASGGRSGASASSSRGSSSFGGGGSRGGGSRGGGGGRRR